LQRRPGSTLGASDLVTALEPFESTPRCAPSAAAQSAVSNFAPLRQQRLGRFGFLIAPKWGDESGRDQASGQRAGEIVYEYFNWEGMIDHVDGLAWYKTVAPEEVLSQRPACQPTNRAAP
jgi:hypothetical protein